MRAPAHVVLDLLPSLKLHVRNARFGPLVGLRNALDLRRNTLRVLLDATETGDVVSVPLPGKQVYALSSPEGVRRVLIENARAYSRRDNLEVPFFRDELGRGMLTTDGDLWLRVRKLHASPFSEARVGGLAGTIASATAKILDTWSCWRPAQAPRDAFPHLIALTAAVSVRCFFTHDLGEEESLELAGALMEAQNYVFAEMLGAVRTPRWAPLPRNLRYRAAVARIERTCREILEARVRAPEGSEGDLLAGLLAHRDPVSGAPLSDQELFDQLRTAVAAAPENMATALTWSIQTMLDHPAWGARIRAESPDARNDVDCFLREILRLYPGAPVATRRTLEDDRIHGQKLEAGSYIVIAPYAIHRNPRFWSEPGRFWPERPEYALAAGSGPERLRYLPFGAGPRRCVGDHFALLLLSIVLPMLARAYRWRPDPTRRAVPGARINLRPQDGFWMALGARSATGRADIGGRGRAPQAGDERDG